MNARYRGAWLVLAFAGLVPAARAVTYPGGSLIIPAQASYQDYCGTASAYGLIYNILRANDGLSAAGKSRILVHWAYKTTKGSPNRCVPTDIQNPPVYGSYTSTNPPPWNDAIWNDGCDFRVTDNTSVPVKLVKNSTGNPADDTNIVTINTTADTTVYPTYGSVTIQQTTNPKVTSVGYLGGPFIISASDASTFLQLLSGTLVVTDANGNTVDFTPFRTPVTCSGTTTGFGGTNPGHYVNVHRALVSFTADDNSSFNAPPPRAAVLESALSGGGSVAGGILSQYLLNAGLNFTGAGGCPPGGVLQANATWKPKYCPTGQSGQIFDYFDVDDFANGLNFLTDANGNPLYQAIWTPHWDAGTAKASVPNPSLSSGSGSPAPAAGTYCYRVSALTGDGNKQVIWGETLASAEKCITTTQAKQITITWSSQTTAIGYRVYGRTKTGEKLMTTLCCAVGYTTTTFVDNGSITPGSTLPPTVDTSGTPPANVVAAMGNMASFLNTPGNGLFGECASIASYEGESGTSQQAAPPSTGAQFQTCVQDSTNPGSCSTTTSVFGVLKNAPGSPSGYLRNCTDPTATAAAACEYFPNPGDPFMQFGDYMWYAQGGSVPNYIPATGMIYKPGTVLLAYNVASLDKSKLTSPATARTMAVSDNSTRTLKDGNPNEGNILYLGGHTFDKYVAGNRIVLGTLLQLGRVYAAAETGYVGPTLYNDSVFVPTYDRITSVPTSAAVKKFDPNGGSQFLFPYHSGHLKTHSLSSGLAQGNNDFTANVQWDALCPGTPNPTPTTCKNTMLAPDKRNVFTYLGGSLTTAGTSLARQTGWAPVDFDYTSIQSPKVNCVDNWSVGQVAANTSTGKPGPYTGMNVASNGVCDLEEALAANLVLGAADFGSDQGASEQAAIKTKLLNTGVGGAVQVTQQLTQLVRGFCYATSTGVDGSGTMVANPTKTQCNFHRGDNVNSIGGFVHSQAAVVAPSPYVTDAPSGKHRPTVAYVGGLDGQIHAFYVPSSDNSDSGYTGPASSAGAPYSSAKGVFHTNWLSTGGFTPPAALTELWSFIPPGQLPYLYSNDATVDSSPAVLDVFGDFDGDGIREWHTVLVASAGGSNRELFALDVSNPLAPVMLWDIESSYDKVALPYAPVPLMDDNTGQGVVALEQSLLWRNQCRAADVAKGASGPCPSAATYVLPPGTDPGLVKTGWFNYSHLGASQSVQAALLRRNNAPVFAAYVATNEPDANGMFVFAIDLTTGQKLWEFSNPYDKDTIAASSDHPKMADALDNTPPAGVTLFSKANTSLIDTVYVGDLQGSLWELDAADGMSNTSYAKQIGTSCSATGSCNFPLSNAFWYDPNAYPQPITTLSTIFIVPSTLSLSSPLANYIGQPMLTYGTAGTDKVSSLAYTVTGSVHLLPLNYAGRLSSTDVIGPPSQFSIASTKGVAKELTGYPQYVASGERLYGSITAAGDHLYFATTKGTVTNIDSRGSLAGSTYSVDLGAAISSSRTALTTTAGGAGGTVLVATNSSGQTRVVTVTDQTINVSPVQTVNLNGPAINGTGQTPTGLISWFFKATGHEY